MAKATPPAYMGEWEVVFFTKVHGSAGCGGANLKDQRGGLAKGTPRKTPTGCANPFKLTYFPRTLPWAVSTIGGEGGSPGGHWEEMRTRQWWRFELDSGWTLLPLPCDLECPLNSLSLSFLCERVKLTVLPNSQGHQRERDWGSHSVCPIPMEQTVPSHWAQMHLLQLPRQAWSSLLGDILHLHKAGGLRVDPCSCSSLKSSLVHPQQLQFV